MPKYLTSELTKTLIEKSKFPKIHTMEQQADEQAARCDPHILITMTELDKLLEENKEYKGMREYDVLKEDAHSIKTDFIKNCACRAKK